MLARPRLLFVITEDWYFWSHRLHLARAARDVGMEIVIATRVQDHGGQIAHEGFKLFPIRLRRRSRHPLNELLAILELFRLYRSQKPDIVHHVAMKPVLYGTVAARLAGVRGIINAFAGLGRAFIAEGPQAKLMRSFIGWGLRWALSSPHSVAIFQNQEDCKRMLQNGLVRSDQARVIRGSGIDTKVFIPLPCPGGEPIVMLASRMLWDKGVGEFVEAAHLLKQQRQLARFVLVGRLDEDNPARITLKQLMKWHEQGLVEWWGHRDDMPQVLASASVVVLPSYREGLPKVLLEAAACGRPIVATDVPGCREIVRDGINGRLVPPKNPEALAEAITMLLLDPALQARMGALGRAIVVSEFSVEKIVDETLAVYRELLNPANPVSCARRYA